MSTTEINSTQLNSILFANHITFDNEYMKCAHKRQKIETAIKKKKEIHEQSIRHKQSEFLGSFR